MASPTERRAEAAELPEGDVIRILLEQHARIRELLARTATGAGQAKQESFDALRWLLAVHETAEEMVLRPVSRDAVGASVTDARNEEEAEATRLLKELEELDVGTVDFDVALSRLKADVEAHAAAEEREEFPHVLRACDEERRRTMGAALLAAEQMAPTHPHPSTAGSTGANYALGPFLSLLDRARDAFRSAAG